MRGPGSRPGVGLIKCHSVFGRGGLGLFQISTVPDCSDDRDTTPTSELRGEPSDASEHAVHQRPSGR